MIRSWIEGYCLTDLLLKGSLFEGFRSLGLLLKQYVSRFSPVRLSGRSQVALRLDYWSRLEMTTSKRVFPA